MKLRKEVKRMKDLENICLSVEHDFDGKYQSVAPEIVQTSSFQLINKRSEEHTSELQSLPRNSYAVFCLKKKIALLRCFSSGGSPHMPMDSAYVTWTFLHVFFFLMIRRPPRSTPL